MGNCDNLPVSLKGSLTLGYFRRSTDITLQSYKLTVVLDVTYVQCSKYALISTGKFALFKMKHTALMPEPCATLLHDGEPGFGMINGSM